MKVRLLMSAAEGRLDIVQGTYCKNIDNIISILNYV